MCWMKLMISVYIIFMTLRQQITPKQNCSMSCDLSLSMKWSRVGWQNSQSQFSGWGAKGLVLNWGVLPTSRHNCIQPLWRWKCTWFGEGSPWLGGQTSTSAKGMSLGSTTETNHLSYCALCPSAWKCIHLSRSPAVSQNRNSPMASKVPRPVSNWTFVGHCSPETASQATRHDKLTDTLQEEWCWIP